MKSMKPGLNALKQMITNSRKPPVPPPMSPDKPAVANKFGKPKKKKNPFIMMKGQQ